MQIAQLIKECKQHSTAAQRCVYDRFAAAMFLLCRRYLKTDEEAEEALMNGFLKFFGSLQRFEYVSDAATVAWLKKIMMNECLAQLRMANSFLQIVSDDLPESIHAENILDDLTAEEIFGLITKLPVGYRTVFNLFAVEGMSHKEIAATLNISEGTSRSQLSKARQLLQSLLIQNNSDYAWRKTK